MSNILSSQRPTRYSAEVALRLCRDFVKSTLSLAEFVEADPGLPDVTTIKLWLGRHATFREAWNSVCAVRLDALSGATDGIDDSTSAAEVKRREAKAPTDWEKVERELEKVEADMRKKMAAFRASRGLPARAGTADRATAGHMPAKGPGPTIH